MGKRKAKQQRRKNRNRRIIDGWNNRTQFGERAGKTRQTIWLWGRKGLLPLPDGRDPFGNPLWRDSTIDNFLAGNSTAA